MKTKTILKEAGLHDTRWGKRIILGEKLGKFVVGNSGLAHSWVTCACGESIGGLPAHKDGEPKDSTLASLGCQFWPAVVSNDFLRAATLLVMIEERAEKVMLELIKGASNENS